MWATCSRKHKQWFRLYASVSYFKDLFPNLSEQVVCLVGVNDKELNYQAADASIRIAKESRRIADDPKKVAILTRRDSTTCVSSRP